MFAPLDLYVGVAQDVKVERCTMQPEEGPQKVHDILTCPRFKIDGKKSSEMSTIKRLDGRIGGIRSEDQP